MRTVLPLNAKLIPNHAHLAFKGVIFDTYQWQQQIYDGTYQTFEMLKRPDTIKVLAIKDNKIVTLWQEQPDRKPSYDLPGGRHDIETESELDAAKRELAEETGLSFQDWKLISISQPQIKIEHFVYLFLATTFEKQTAQRLDAGERIEVLYQEFDSVKRLVSSQGERWAATRAALANVATLDELIELPEYKGRPIANNL